MRFLAAPNLPLARARVILTQACPAAEALRATGFTVLSPSPNAALPAETAGHADLLFCHAGENVIFAEPSQTALARRLRDFGFDVRFCAPLGGAYPLDVPLNVAVGDTFALGNFKHADAALLKHLKQIGKTLINVRQGYAKCGLCFVTSTAFITEDAGIARALRANGMDALLISPGDVFLSEKHTGFFGGAAGLISPDTLAVNGSLRTHRDGEKIRAFLKTYGVRPMELSDGQITDIGGILPLTEG